MFRRTAPTSRGPDRGQASLRVADRGRGVERLAHPLGRLFDPELAHGLAIQVLGLMPVPPRPADDPRLSVPALWLQFPNPVRRCGVFDKNAQVADRILQRGFGFAEIGTVTPQRQPGNRRPRVFRLLPDRAVITGLGSIAMALITFSAGFRRARTAASSVSTSGPTARAWTAPPTTQRASKHLPSWRVIWW